MVEYTDSPEEVVSGKGEPADIPEEHPPFDNLADEEKIVSKFFDFGRKKFEQFASDREEYDDEDDGVWAVADYMFASGRDDTTRGSKSDDDTLADTGSPVFHREVRTIASQLLAILNSKAQPAHYVPLMSYGIFANLAEAEEQARQHNTLMKYTRKKDGRSRKDITYFNLLSRYGNQPIIKKWHYEKATRTERVPIRDGDGKITGYEFEDKEYVVHNEPSNTVIPIENLYADRHIGNLQDQSCIVIKDNFGLSDAYTMEQAGEAINIDKISKMHYYRGGTSDLHGQHEENRGVEEGDDSETDLLEGHHIWAKVPIKKIDGKYVWDEKKHKPVWWWGVFVGRINGSTGPQDPTALCLLLRRNYDPDDEFPGFMGTLLPDNEDSLYHIAPCQIIETLYDQLVTKQNQAIDNVTLMNRRPLIVKRGNVLTKNLKYEPDAIWITENGKEDI